MSTTTRVDLELKVGYEDSDGTLHKTVTMRQIKNKDIIAMQKDVRIKALAKDKDLNVDSSNPVAAMAGLGAMLEMFSMMFSLVVEKIGSIEKPNVEVFKGLYQEDMMFLIDEYNILNGNIKEGADKGSPLAVVPG